MPNLCYYEMKIKGTKENCEQWVRKMESYDEPDHFFRMFSPIECDGEGTDDDYSMKIWGDCAWSLESCCRSGYTNEDLFAKNTKALNLDMEVFSQEEGCEFQEHYIYKKGECICDECVDWEEYYYDTCEFDTFEKFKTEYDLPSDLTEDDLDEGEYYHVGGFEDWGVFEI